MSTNSNHQIKDQIDSSRNGKRALSDVSQRSPLVTKVFKQTNLAPIIIYDIDQTLANDPIKIAELIKQAVDERIIY